MPGVSYNQGDIILISFPYSDLSGSKVRPAIIISNSVVNKTTDLICAQITSQIYKDDFSFELKSSEITVSLNGYSEVRCHKIFTADKTLIRKKISHLHQPVRLKLLEKMKQLL